MQGPKGVSTRLLPSASFHAVPKRRELLFLLGWPLGRVKNINNLV